MKGPIQLPVFRARCSQIGKLMTKPWRKADAEKNYGLSQSTITYLETWVREQIYGHAKQFSTKYTRKGNAVEDDAIEFASGVLDWGMVFKNEEARSNDHVVGTCDVVLSDCIPDIKSSWDQFTFPLFETKLPNSDYYWQLQGYMDLWNKNHAQVVYVLMDAPEDEIEKAARWKASELGLVEVTQDVYESVRGKMVFSHLPDWMRIKVFDVHRNDEDIQHIHEKVEQCRTYIKLNLIPALEEQFYLYSGQNRYDSETII